MLCLLLGSNGNGLTDWLQIFGRKCMMTDPNLSEITSAVKRDKFRIGVPCQSSQAKSVMTSWPLLRHPYVLVNFLTRPDPTRGSGYPPLNSASYQFTSLRIQVFIILYVFYLRNISPKVWHHALHLLLTFVMHCTPRWWKRETHDDHRWQETVKKKTSDGVISNVEPSQPLRLPRNHDTSLRRRPTAWMDGRSCV